MIDDHAHDRLVPATGASIAVQGRPGSFADHRRWIGFRDQFET
jgi:hypothetical protein